MTDKRKNTPKGKAELGKYRQQAKSQKLFRGVMKYQPQDPKKPGKGK